MLALCFEAAIIRENVEREKKDNENPLDIQVSANVQKFERLCTGTLSDGKNLRPENEWQKKTAALFAGDISQ